MNVNLIRKACTWENVEGHYFNVLPVITVYPKTPGFRDDSHVVHIGWLKWVLYIRFGFAKETP